MKYCASRIHIASYDKITKSMDHISFSALPLRRHRDILKGKAS